MATKASLTATQDAFAGALGAAISLITVYPLDISKTKLQVQTTTKETTYTTLMKIYKEEGILGLYTGIASALIQTFSGNYSYFFWYKFIRTYYLKKYNQLSTISELAIGAFAGGLCQITTIPISVVVTRQQTTPKKLRKSLVNTWREIISENGWIGLYKGFAASILLTINPSITYGVYQKLKAACLRIYGNTSPVQILLLGALSKTLATIVTYPYIMAKTRLQWKPTLENDKMNYQYKSAWDVIQKVIDKEGFFGLYQGLSAQIGKAVLAQALLFVLKDKIERTAIKLLN
eukprot:NODE_1205_length_1795_cov_1.280660.p1 type:complete len:290 gc:universal NODE_1205_length_1795_cov_1.280660:811-1680(+)